MRQLLLSVAAMLMIALKFKSYWPFAEKMKKCGLIGESIRESYLDRWCSYIGKDTYFASTPILPHGFHCIHISSGSKIGKNVVIFQNVTIGSNTLNGSRRQGAPTVGDNVYIGAGAAIIGDVHIGNNCRIGANCVVVEDMPENTVAVIGNIRYIRKDYPLDNTFVDWKSYNVNIQNKAKKEGE